MKYAEKLKDPRWQKVRLRILERDQWACVICDAGTKTLHVHHTLYLPGAEPWEADESCLVTMCADCHEAEHAAQREALIVLRVALALGAFATSVQIDALTETIAKLASEGRPRNGGEWRQLIASAIVEAPSL